nr:hypothetical protein GCM10020093_033270 [Planobispora longispora]
MLKVRHHDPARRDLDAALAWVNEAIAISTLLPDPGERAFKLGFDLNGRALIEVRRGRPAKALEFVQRAVELADGGLRPDEHPIHRMVLLANRAQLSVMLGDPEGALADLNRVIDADPGYPDYYIDRGNLLYRLGRPAEAVADYETAVEVGPPFPEPYYNRAEVRFSAGDYAGALADLDHALELDPDFVDALANRAGLLVALGEYGRARADAEAGLALEEGNPYLLCALGQVEMAEGATRRRGPPSTGLWNAPLAHRGLGRPGRAGVRDRRPGGGGRGLHPRPRTGRGSGAAVQPGAGAARGGATGGGRGRPRQGAGAGPRGRGRSAGVRRPARRDGREAMIPVRSRGPSPR